MPSLWLPGRRRTHKELAAQVHARRKEGLELAAKAVSESFGEMGTIEKAQALGVNLGGMLGTNNLGNTAMQQSLISKVTNNLGKQFDATPQEVEEAMASAGLSWGPPFPPGRPLDPFFGVRQPARTWDFSVGENVQITPRWNRVSFPTIKALYEAYDVAQICVRHLINDIRSLDYAWMPARNVKEDVSADVQIAEAFFESPDGRQPFENWLAEWLQDILRYDAGCLYERCNNGGQVTALEVVDGTTIIPLVDYFGRRPMDTDDDDGSGEMDGGAVTPAFVQIIQGMPWDWLSVDDLIYTPWNPLPESQYGLAPLEAVLLSANTDIRFQWHFLQFFTEGTLPAGFMEAPPDMSDPAQLADWENNWNAIMLGDQAKLRQIRWVPAGAKFTAAKANADQFTSEFPLYLMRRTCASFGVTPNDLGFTESVNRATGDTQIDVQFRVGVRPLLKHVQALINLFIAKKLGLRCRLQFDDGQEVEDRVATAQAHCLYIGVGVESPDEVRSELGLPIDKDNPMPRFINNAKIGPQPLAEIIGSSGMVDPETFAPTQDAITAVEEERAKAAAAQDAAATPVPGGPPAPPPQIPGGVAANADDSSTDSDEDDTAAAKSVGWPSGARVAKRGAIGTHLGFGLVAWDDGSVSKNEGTPTGEITDVPWRDTLKLLDRLEKDQSMGGAATAATSGVTSETGIRGSDLLGDEDEDDDDEPAQKQLEIGLSLRRWRRNTQNRLRKGQAPKLFVDPTLPDEIRDGIWGELHGTRDVAKAMAVFDAADKATGEWLDFTKGS